MEIKYKELYVYVLGILKRLKDNGKYSQVSLNDVVLLIRPKTKMDEIIQIAKYLEADGDLNADYKLGQIFVSILPKGIINWENNSDVFDKKLNEILGGTDINQVKTIDEKRVEDDDFRGGAIHLVQDMYEKMKPLDFVNPDLKIEVQILLLELKKIDADTSLIKQKIDHIGQSINAMKEIAEFKEQLALTD